MPLSVHDNRRQFLVTAAGKTFAGVAAGCQLLTGYDLQPQTVNAFGVQPEPDQNESAVNLHSWQQDDRNPVFVPESEFDQRGAQCCSLCGIRISGGCSTPASAKIMCSESASRNGVAAIPHRMGTAWPRTSAWRS